MTRTCFIKLEIKLKVKLSYRENIKTKPLPSHLLSLCFLSFTFYITSNISIIHLKSHLSKWLNLLPYILYTPPHSTILHLMITPFILLSKHFFSPKTTFQIRHVIGPQSYFLLDLNFTVHFVLHSLYHFQYLSTITNINLVP